MQRAITSFDEAEEENKATSQKLDNTQGPNEKKAIAYLDGFTSFDFLTDAELEAILKAKKAISSGKFQQLQRDVNKLQTATRKVPVSPAILVEKMIKIILSYPLEHIDLSMTAKDTDDVKVKIKKELKPEIIISESFNI